jgi:hypothetical protein
MLTRSWATDSQMTLHCSLVQYSGTSSLPKGSDHITSERKDQCYNFTTNRSLNMRSGRRSHGRSYHDARADFFFQQIPATVLILAQDQYVSLQILQAGTCKSVDYTAIWWRCRVDYFMQISCDASEDIWLTSKRQIPGRQ